MGGGAKRTIARGAAGRSLVPSENVHASISITAEA